MIQQFQLLCVQPQTIESRVPVRYVHTHILRSIIHKNPKVEAKCPSTEEWVSGPRFIHTWNITQPQKGGGDSDTCSNTMNLEDIMLRKNTIGCYFFEVRRGLNSWRRKLTRGWRERGGTVFQFCNITSFGCVMFAQQCECIQGH